MNKKQVEQARKILATLSRQKFADWYGPDGDFDNFITGETPISEDEILVQICNLFGIKA